MTVQTVFPVTRIHEPLRLDVDVQDGRVVEAYLGSHLFRGIEQMLEGRDPRDAALFTQRICGICSCAHAVSANFAQQQAFGVKATAAGQHLINLIFAADIIQNHIRHFYILNVFDYAKPPEIPPYAPLPKADYRLPPNINAEVLEHAKEAAQMAARAHEMLAVFGAKVPHQQTIIPTGITEQASPDRLGAYASILDELTEWVEEAYVADTQTIAKYYPDYYNIGRGYGNFLSYGMFPAPLTGERRDFVPGIVTNGGQREELDVSRITEGIRYSWYKDEQAERHPAAGVTIPNRDKAEAYTWIKSPRYNGLPFEGGPLARGFINGDYRRGISTMDRIVARSLETLKICRLAKEWLKQIVPNSPSHLTYTPPASGSGVGLTDAMRGPLGHWLEYKNNKISHYQIVTPTTWNFSPRDDKGVRGPVEQALLGTPIAEGANLIEAGRVIRAYDPCFTCAIHQYSPTLLKSRLIPGIPGSHPAGTPSPVASP